MEYTGLARAFVDGLSGYVVFDDAQDARFVSDHVLCKTWLADPVARAKAVAIPARDVKEPIVPAPVDGKVAAR